MKYLLLFLASAYSMSQFELVSGRQLLRRADAPPGQYGQVTVAGANTGTTQRGTNGRPQRFPETHWRTEGARSSRTVSHPDYVKVSGHATPGKESQITVMGDHVHGTADITHGGSVDWRTPHSAGTLVPGNGRSVSGQDGLNMKLRGTGKITGYAAASREDLPRRPQGE